MLIFYQKPEKSLILLNTKAPKRVVYSYLVTRQKQKTHTHTHMVKQIAKLKI